MILYIKKKAAAFKETYNVFDENNNLIYKVVADLFSLTKTFRLFDLNQKEIGNIKQKLTSVMPTYIVTKGENEIGTIKKNLTLYKGNFDVDYKNFNIIGDIMNWNFEVKNNDNTVVSQIEKLPLNLMITYKISLLNDDDKVDIILFVIALVEAT